MTQTIFLPPSNLPTYAPQSPDPTPLRMIACSVAESALQSDPNSPSFDTLPRAPRPYVGQWLDQWSWDDVGAVPMPAKASKGARRAGERRRLMNLVERAKERRLGENNAVDPPVKYSRSTPSSPPSSPSYNFVLPSNTPLAASIAATPRHQSLFGQRTDVPTPPNMVKRSDTPPGSVNRPAPPNITVTPPSKKTAPLYIRSAEPSPTRPMFGGLSPTASTFAGLDRDKPPPEFVPRLSAKELSAKLRINESGRRASMAEVESNVPQLHRQIVKLPSLAQIKAKVSKTDDDIPRTLPRADPSEPAGINGNWRTGRRGSAQMPWRLTRTDSQGSIEVLRTPVDDVSPHARILSSVDRRPATPPSPTLQHGKETHRLASFLRQRTSGRLNKARPVSMPPLAPGQTLNLDLFLPPKQTMDPQSTSTSPTGRFFAHHDESSLPGRAAFTGANITTPPHRGMSFTPSLISPTDSTRSYRTSSCGGSPTLAVPMITCTPAPARMLKDGVEQDSDEEEGDVVLFEGEGEWSDAEDGLEERGKLARMMKERLELRRTSQ